MKRGMKIVESWIIKINLTIFQEEDEKEPMRSKEEREWLAIKKNDKWQFVF